MRFVALLSSLATLANIAAGVPFPSKDQAVKAGPEINKRDTDITLGWAPFLNEAPAPGNRRRIADTACPDLATAWPGYSPVYVDELYQFLGGGATLATYDVGATGGGYGRCWGVITDAAVGGTNYEIVAMVHNSTRLNTGWLPYASMAGVPFNAPPTPGATFSPATATRWPVPNGRGCWATPPALP
ncbi:hypothetical protein TWF696_006372 [Orbilia brochopaga]|uniref:Uncharacterized protein n=1 Tax=Orbilia brochopaga TaxID=3140254 RepID=A0AAV9V2H2_9PEZI